MGEPIGGADRVQKKKERREPRQDRRADPEQLRADHRRLDALPVRHVAAPHDRVRDRQGRPVGELRAHAVDAGGLEHDRIQGILRRPLRRTG